MTTHDSAKYHPRFTGEPLGEITKACCGCCGRWYDPRDCDNKETSIDGDGDPMGCCQECQDDFNREENETL